MRKIFPLICLTILVTVNQYVFGQADTNKYIQKDLKWVTDSPAGFVELQLPSAGSLLQGFMYKANGNKPHPTLLLLHGFPGNERNLDLAQAVRAHGWNVIYFNYRGSWGSQGEFSFRHCVEDVKNIVAYCRKNAALMQIDPRQIALFGHSMGGFVCLKALQEMHDIRKGFVLSAWDIYRDVSESVKKNKLSMLEKEADNYFVLNKQSGKALYAPVMEEEGFYNLLNAPHDLAKQEIVMLDEHPANAALASAIKNANKNYCIYEVWNTDHSFTNKRVSLINKVITFLDR